MNLFLKFAEEAVNSARQALERATAENQMTKQQNVRYLTTHLFAQIEILSEALFNRSRRTKICQGNDTLLFSKAVKINKLHDELQTALDSANPEQASPRTPRSQLIRPYST